MPKQSHSTFSVSTGCCNAPYSCSCCSLTSIESGPYTPHKSTLEKTMRGLLIASSIALFAMTVPVLAHHGTGTYDSSKSVTLSGIVTEFAFTNPHAAMFVDVKDESGKTVNWAIEMNSPGVLARAGWTKKMFKYGDQITITVRPAKAGTPVGLLYRQKPVIVNGKEVLKADGTANAVD